MKKYLPVITLAAAAYGIIFWLRKKASAGSNLKYEPVDVAIDLQKIKSSLFTRIYYKVKLNLINNESVDVNIKSVNLNVSIGNRPFGSIVKNEMFTVPRRSNQIVALETSFSSFSAIALIKDIIVNGFKDPIIVNGYIETDLGRVNINFTKNPSGKLTGFKPYDVSYKTKYGKNMFMKKRNSNILSNIQGNC